jgi:hypothetical protein
MVADVDRESEAVGDAVVERVIVLETEKESDGVDVTETVMDMQYDDVAIAESDCEAVSPTLKVMTVRVDVRVLVSVGVVCADSDVVTTGDREGDTVIDDDDDGVTRAVAVVDGVKATDFEIVCVTELVSDMEGVETGVAEGHMVTET